jgi:hypothetical protein
MNRTQSPPKHTSHARRKTCCHGGVGINTARGRPPSRLTQLHGSQSASEEGTTSPLFGCARPSRHRTPANHPHQSGQRDSNPRHSAWETRVPSCACARKCLAVLRSGVTIPERVPFVPVVSCKVCTRGYRRARFDELSGAMDVVHSCKRRVITNYRCNSIARLETPTNQLS